MKVLDLCSGIGGFSIGLENAGMETITFCEIEEFCQKVLKKHWPNVPIAGDLKKLSYNRTTMQLWYKTKVIYVGTIDLICGGYPCQPFSVAGKRRGKEDDRHLWPEVFRLIQETNPNWFIGENVAGHISLGLDQVLFDMESQNYETQTFIIPACGVDAPHRRNRVWIVGNSKHNGSPATKKPRGAAKAGKNKQKREEQAIELKGASVSANSCAMANTDSRLLKAGSEHTRRKERGNTNKHNSQARPVAYTTLSNDRSSYASATTRQKHKPGNSCCKKDVCHPNAAGLQEREVLSKIESQKRSSFEGQAAERTSWWPAEPAVGRVANGVPRRVDRLRALGNAVVPQIPEMIGRAIMATKDLECR